MIENKLYPHAFHVDCFLNHIQADTRCPKCQLQFINTEDDIRKAEDIAIMLNAIANGAYDSATGVTELPVTINAGALGTCVLVVAH